MKLHEHMLASSLLRSSDEPDEERGSSIITLAQDLKDLPGWLKEHRQLKIDNLFIADLEAGSQVSIHFPKAHGEPQIHCGVADIPHIRNTRFIFYNPKEWVVRALCMNFPNLASQKTWLAGALDAALKRRKPIAAFYESHAKELEQAFSLLETEADRDVFAARLKALSSGDPGYLPIASHLEYQHPFIRPEKGDCMIDGGVSDMTQAQEGFAKAVGQSGKVYGFEPIPWMAEKAGAQLTCFPQYCLTAAGLAAADGIAEFTDLRDSSRLGAAPGGKVVECRLASIDSFARSNDIQKIDCIKLDIEGAELSALQGAKEIICRDRPKLIICLYHKPMDLYEIPTYIHELVPEYRLHVAHSSAGFTDTILYAAV